MYKRQNIALVNIVKKLTRRTEKYNGINEILIDLSNFMYVKADIEENEEIDAVSYTHLI